MPKLNIHAWSKAMAEAVQKAVRAAQGGFLNVPADVP